MHGLVLLVRDVTVSAGKGDGEVRLVAVEVDKKFLDICRKFEHRTHRLSKTSHKTCHTCEAEGT